MLGWLTKKGENARVAMCSKELKWDLENAPPSERAIIRALSAYFFETLISEVARREIFDDPFSCMRPELVDAYSALEMVRNQNKAQLAATETNMKRLGLTFPDFAKKHAEACGRALESWMVILGLGIRPDSRADVLTAWRFLRCERDQLLSAFAHIRDIEERTSNMTGAVDGGTFCEIADADWLRMCDFVPKCVQ